MSLSVGDRLSRRLSNNDDGSFPILTTRNGNLHSIIRTRSSQSLPSLHGFRASGSDDEETGSMRGVSRMPDSEELGRLLMDERRLTQILNGPQARSMKLIGRNNPRYRWEQYWKSEEELRAMSKPIRKYYERTNELIEQYLYIDCLLDSAIPHDLLNEYSAQLEASAFRPLDVPATISEQDETTPPSRTESSTAISTAGIAYGTVTPSENGNGGLNAIPQKKRTPKDIFRSSENMPVLPQHDDDDESVEVETEESPLLAAENPKGKGLGPRPNLPWLEDGEVESDAPIVTLAIWINFVANAVLLAGKIAVIISIPSMSVLASLVDAVLDFLSTAIVWTTTRAISASQKDQDQYPVGRKRLEPVGVLVFSVVMITAFCQVALECIQKLAGPDREILQLGIPAISIMVGTIIIKGACWVWCRVVKNSSVRALAEDAKTDIIFNTGSILFPIIGFYGRVWWLDATGGLLLSLVVVFNWTQTSAHHVRNLTGFSAQPDERNLLLYLTMRFATAIRQIQNLRAYHAGDKLFVEVDIVLSANMPLKDSHDLSEVLTYFLESVPIVDRAFVHVDYASYNAPTHILKQSATT